MVCPNVRWQNPKQKLNWMHIKEVRAATGKILMCLNGSPGPLEGESAATTFVKISCGSRPTRIHEGVGGGGGGKGLSTLNRDQRPWGWWTRKWQEENQMLTGAKIGEPTNQTVSETWALLALRTTSSATPWISCWPNLALFLASQDRKLRMMHVWKKKE